jgi:methyltransferase (TIGR00027 family)
VPASVRFVASDFTQQRLEAAVSAAGYRSTVRSLFLWEGVTNYLTEAAVDSTLRWCAGAAPGSRLIFTYIDVAVLTHPERFFGANRLLSTLQNVDEKLTFGIDPSKSRDFVAARGLTLETDVGAAEYRRCYFGAAAGAMRGHEFYRVAVASVR